MPQTARRCLVSLHCGRACGPGHGDNGNDGDDGGDGDGDDGGDGDVDVNDDVDEKAQAARPWSTTWAPRRHLHGR